MKRAIQLFILIMSFVSVYGQGQNINSYESRFAKVSFLLQNKKTKDAYDILTELKNQVPKNDTLYTYVIWNHTTTATKLGKEALTKQNYQASLQYNLDALNSIKTNKERFNDSFSNWEYWTIKDIIVSNFGLGKFDETEKNKEILYKAYQNKTLPEDIDNYFNFDFFKLGDNNIWGYEWYPELPDDRFSSSFTKVVYYVYSTNPDGSDKEQLYRFHVLMYHQDSNDAKFDYILEKQQETDDFTVSGSYYKYTYKKKIDYKKLRDDIKNVITENTQPDTRRTTKKL